VEHQNYVFVGVDTHKNQHTAYVLNCFHQKIVLTQTPNNPASFESFIQDISSFKTPDKSDEIDAEARNTIIKSTIEHLRLLAKSLEKINKQLKKAVEKSQYQLTTMPGINFKLAALFISN